MPAAVIFDLDGVLVDSEHLWNRAKEEYVRATGGQWREDAPEAMIGMSSPEWSAYIRDELRVDRPATEINGAVVQRIEELYRTELPLLPGAVDTVRAMERRWPLGLASSSNREIIDLVIEEAGLTGAFVATVSSEEVARGKPSPDVYLEAARRMGVDPRRCVAIEDSANGLRSAHAAGMAAVAVPNPDYPPGDDALDLAAVSVNSIAEVTPELVQGLAA